MNEVLSSLIALQETDSSIIKKKSEIEDNPKTINHYKRPLHESELALKKILNRFESVEKKKRQKDLELMEISERIEKVKSRTGDIKTNKEYQAHLKEIDSLEKIKYSIEDDILNIMEEIEEESRIVNETERRVEEEKKNFQLIEKNLKQKMEETKKELSELLEKRSSIVSQIPEDFYHKYMENLQRSNGLAIVEVKDEVCLGCHMSIPPQLYVEIKSNNEICRCLQCNRFLYWKAL